MSTVSPKTARLLAHHGFDREISVLDVTISGSTPVAEKGSLVLFGGGEYACFQAAESIFLAISQKHFHLGPSGSGATMKLVANTLLGTEMQAIAEGVALGEKAGLERNRLLEVLSQTAVVAPAHVGKLLRAMEGEFSAQFPLRLMNKDFGLILGLAEAVGARVPATKAAFEVNAKRLVGEKEEDFSAVILEMEDENQLLLRTRPS
jgi:3-hydroxyisobutyrate dehydrogenase